MAFNKAGFPKRLEFKVSTKLSLNIPNWHSDRRPDLSGRDSPILSNICAQLTHIIISKSMCANKETPPNSGKAMLNRPDYLNRFTQLLVEDKSHAVGVSLAEIWQKYAVSRSPVGTVAQPATGFGPTSMY